MEDKPWYKSKTIWGSIVAVIALIAGMFGYQVDAASQQEIVTAMVGVAGGIFAIWGRFKAVSKVTVGSK